MIEAPTGLVKTFFVPGHGLSEEISPGDFRSLRRGFKRGRLGMHTVNWVNGTNTTPSDQTTYLGEVIREWHADNPFEPFVLASHSRGSMPVFEQTALVEGDPELNNRFAGLIFLSPAPYHKPVFTSFKENMESYPTDYIDYPPELQESLEGYELPELSRDVPILLLSGRNDTPFTHQMEGAIMQKYPGRTIYGQVKSTKDWHPYFSEYARNSSTPAGLAKYGRIISGIDKPTEHIPICDFTEFTDGRDFPQVGLNFVRMPRGKVAMLGTDQARVFSPGQFVDFMYQTSQRDYNPLIDDD